MPKITIYINMICPWCISAVKDILTRKIRDLIIKKLLFINALTFLQKTYLLKIEYKIPY
jgi:predicted DsbA family dithiol-disulfide isomerase